MQATRIHIDIERGGLKLIRIRDNGCVSKKMSCQVALRVMPPGTASLDHSQAIISLAFAVRRWRVSVRFPA